MYLRHSTVTKNGKTHTYWRPVRVGRKVRQVTVAQLGGLDAKGRVAARQLADSLVGVDRQPGLFDEGLPTEPVTVVPGRLRLERGRRLGDVWLAWKPWQALGLDTWLEKRLSRGRADVPWSLMAAVLVIARLCEPSSELHIAEDWFRRTALGDLLGLPEAKVNDDRLYRALAILQELLDPVPRARHLGHHTQRRRFVAIAEEVLDLGRRLQRSPHQEPNREAGLPRPHRPDPHRRELEDQRSLGPLAHTQRAYRSGGRSGYLFKICNSPFSQPRIRVSCASVALPVEDLDHQPPYRRGCNYPLQFAALSLQVTR
ncbi:MAG: hypothetical protein JOZ53_20840 [Planctomycetaceae bacterium]|nr:hypothetical protein [Planctomycetaceae bacterium]